MSTKNEKEHKVENFLTDMLTRYFRNAKLSLYRVGMASRLNGLEAAWFVRDVPGQAWTK